MNYFIFLIELFFKVYIILVVIRALLPWMPVSKFNLFVRYVYEVTDPLLNSVRKGLPPMKIGFDASPFVAIVILWMLKEVLLAILKGMWF